jgi:phosphoglycolate phosphatase
MKELYIFDFDGTLVDSYRDSIKYFNVTLLQFNLPTFDMDVEGLDYQIFREFIHKQMDGIEDEFMKQFTINYKDSPQHNTRLYDGVIEVLEKLRKRNITLAICSNRDQENLEEMVGKLFENVEFKYISGEKEGLPNKPDPYRLNQIIQEAGIDKDKVLYFGDKVADIEAAKASGVDMILVSYGQGNDEAYCDEYPLKIIDSPEKILDF